MSRDRLSVAHNRASTGSWDENDMVRIAFTGTHVDGTGDVFVGADAAHSGALVNQHGSEFTDMRVANGAANDQY